MWRIFIPTFLILLLSLAASTLFATRILNRFGLDSTASSLRARAIFVSDAISAGAAAGAATSTLNAARSRTILERIKQLGVDTDTRITLIAGDGRVIADSHHDPRLMDNHGSRPEIQQAIRNGSGNATRWSDTLGREMLYFALAVNSSLSANRADPAAPSTAWVRTAVSTDALAEAEKTFYRSVTAGGALIALLAAMLSFAVSRRLSLPLEQLGSTARAFASGDLGARASETGSRETAELAASMNSMAAQLSERMQAVVRQRNQQEAVLAGMVEGVLALDANGLIITINQAACLLLGTTPAAARNRPLSEVVSNPDLRDFAARAARAGDLIESRISVLSPDTRHLQLHGAPLLSAEGSPMGAVIVMNDVTRIEALETLRRDFVANVSHELKTPITSVKGFLETLLDGDLDDPGQVRRFVGIASKQAGRLDAIIDDLLTLSRLEQNDGTSEELVTSPCPLTAVINGAVEVCSLRAAEKNIKVSVDCPADLSLQASAALLEQALVNLVDNAIKYSDNGGRVLVMARGVPDDKNRLRIEVRDSGCGVDADKQQRLFERFYRVDKARSRQMGGTGLGLAIVKHIASAHGGTTGVDSVAGRGSTFWIEIPSADDTGIVGSPRAFDF